MTLIGFGLGFAYAFFCLIVGLIAYKLGLEKKYSRKLVHILVGFEWFFLYYTLGAGLNFLLVCLFFLLLLTLSYFKNLMPMISSDEDNAPGTVYYAVAMSIVAAVGCFLPEVMLPFGVGIMCTSLGDGLAGVIGQALSKFSPRIYRNKTLLGTLACFVISALSAYVFTLITPLRLSVIDCILIGLLSAELELVTVFGLDNITITLGATALAYSLAYFTNTYFYIVPVILTLPVIAVVSEKSLLTRGGILLAILLDATVSIVFGNFGFILLATFLFGGVIIDKIKKRAKKQGRTEEEKPSHSRDALQVAANGAVPALIALLYFITKNQIFILAYIASLAEAFADTAASGLGAFAKRVIDPFRLKSIQNGLSGGMSIVGTLSALVGAFAFSALGFFFGISPMLWVKIALLAFLGTLIDSLLGSLLQVKYRCSVCGAITERREHCGARTERYSGISFINNDIVNFISVAFTSLLAILLL